MHRVRIGEGAAPVRRAGVASNGMTSFAAEEIARARARLDEYGFKPR
jgi:hypothetical protein